MTTTNTPRKLALAIFALLLASGTVRADGWSQEMGPERRGVTPEQPEVVAWGEAGPRVLWRANVGYGSAPVAVVDGRVFTFGAFKAGGDLTAGPTPEQVAWAGFDRVGGGNKAKPEEGTDPEERIATWVQAYDAATGERLWATRIADDIDPVNDIHWSHAAPLVADGRVFVHTYYGVLAALNAEDGAIAWRHDLAEVVDMGDFTSKGGNFCSPLLLPDGSVAVSHPAPEGGGTVRWMQASAFEAATGAHRWTSASFGEGFRSNKSSISLAQFDGAPTILMSTGGVLAGIDPVDGSTRWSRSFEDVFPEYGRLRHAGREYRDHPELLRAIFEEEVPGGGEAEWEKWYHGAQYGAYRVAWPNRMPMAWNDHIVDRMYIFHQQRESHTFGLRMEDGEPVLDWQAPELADAHGYVVLHEGKVYGMDHREGGWNTPGSGGFESKPYHQRGPRPDHIKQFQCYDIASGELLWSSDVLTRGEPEESTNFYDGSGRFIIAGDHVVLWGREGLRVARIKPEGGLELVAEHAVRSSYPSIPVFADGRLYLRRLNPNSSQRHDPFFNNGRGQNLIVIDISAKAN